MSETMKELGAHIERKRAECVLNGAVDRAELWPEIAPTPLTNFAEFQKIDATCKFSTLVDFAAADHPQREARVDMIYHFGRSRVDCFNELNGESNTWQ